MELNFKTHDKNEIKTMRLFVGSRSQHQQTLTELACLQNPTHHHCPSWDKHAWSLGVGFQLRQNRTRGVTRLGLQPPRESCLTVGEVGQKFSIPTLCDSKGHDEKKNSKTRLMMPVRRKHVKEMSQGKSNVKHIFFRIFDICCSF